MRKNPFLAIYFILSFLLAACSNGQEVSYNDGNNLIQVREFDQKLKELKDVQLLDVRTPAEYESGYIQHAVNIDYNAGDFGEQLKKLDKNKPVMVYCKGGGRSAKAAAELDKAGFKTIYDLKGGIMAWVNAELPVEAAQANQPVNKFSVKDFELLRTSHPKLLVDYYARWCAPCKKMEPILQKLKEEFDGQITIVRIDVDEAAALSKQLGIEGIPVVALYKNGQEIKRLQGEQTESDLRVLIEELQK